MATRQTFSVEFKREAVRLLDEQYGPAPLREEDIVEYHTFVKGLYLRWQKEKVGASTV